MSEKFSIIRTKHGYYTIAEEDEWYRGKRDTIRAVEIYLGCSIEEAKRRLELPQGRVIRKSERPEFGD